MRQKAYNIQKSVTGAYLPLSFIHAAYNWRMWYKTKFNQVLKLSGQ
ncbi:MAG: hypothetical protein ABIG84_04720 [archaeon]